MHTDLSLFRQSVHAIVELSIASIFSLLDFAFSSTFCSSHAVLNAYAIIPRGPDVLADLALPHNRASL